MKQKTISATTRKSILEAANKIVLEQGVRTLTLESTAREAGVSKGGLLYHFPNKKSLIKGMVDKLISGFETMLEQELLKSDGNWLVAYVRASFQPPAEHNQISGALVAAIAIEPELLKPLQERFDEWQEKCEQLAPTPEIGTIIRLALDGMLISDLLDFAPLAQEARQNLIDTLIEMVTKEI